MAYKIKAEFDQLENRVVYWVYERKLLFVWWPICGQRSIKEAQTVVDNLERINSYNA